MAAVERDQIDDMLDMMSAAAAGLADSSSDDEAETSEKVATHTAKHNPWTPELAPTYGWDCVDRAYEDEAHSAYTLTDSQMQEWRENGCLLIPDFFDPQMLSNLCEQVYSWARPGLNERENPDDPTYSQHFEMAREKRVLCRVENFVPFHAGWRDLAHGRMLRVASQLFGERVCLFKEKINVKRPGGGGYAPHCDGPSAASTGLAEDFITCQVAIDAQTKENGCLLVNKGVWPPGSVELVPPEYGGDPDRSGRVGAIPNDVAAAMPWTIQESPAGSAFFFNGWLPHRSPANISDTSRRTGYFFFNPATQGAHHKEYYSCMAHARSDYQADLRNILQMHEALKPKGAPETTGDASASAGAGAGAAVGISTAIDVNATT